MVAFLSSLPIDLAQWYGTLKAKGLGKQDELFPLGKTSSEYLEGILREVVPEMPEAHRYVLWRGLQGYP